MDLLTSKPPVAWFSFDSTFGVSFGAWKYPNAANRFFQRWLLGIYWKRA